MKMPTALRSWIALVWTLQLVACGGGGDTSSGSAPVISNLSVSPQAVYASSTPLTFNTSFDFSDPEGNVATLTLRIVDGTGNTINLGTEPIAGVAGMTSGTILGQLMATAVNPDTYTVQINVTDATQLSSNVLSRQLRIAAFPWTSLLAGPTQREYAASAVLGGKLYVVGGQLTLGCTTPCPATDIAEVYDTATNTWSAANPMPTSRMGLVAVAYNGKLYAIGGSTDGFGTSAVGTVEEYDPATGFWTTRTPMPTPRHFAAAATTSSPVGNLIVVAGGEASDGSRLSTVESYNPATNAWVGRSALPAPRSQLAMATGANGRLYAVGGHAGLTIQWTSEVAEYDPLADTWAQRAPMPTPRAHLAVAQINGQLLAAGGENVSRSLDVLESYNPTANVWSSKTASTQAFTRATAGVVDGRMYVFGNGLAFQYGPANEIR